MNYTRTNYKAFKKECYWCFGQNGWKLSDYEGLVYKENGRFWLRTPTGFVEVSKEDFIKHK